MRNESDSNYKAKIIAINHYSLLIIIRSKAPLLIRFIIFHSYGKFRILVRKILSALYKNYWD